MELRLLALDDQTALRFLMAEAFSGGDRPAPSEEPEVAAPSKAWGVFDGARLVAAATVHDLHLTWGSHDAPMGGVAGVACTVDQRGRGHVARLLAHALGEMRETGQYLSALYPFSYTFYRRHGWDWVGERRGYTVPTSELKSSPEGKNVRTYDGPEALQIVKPVYAAFARRYRGMATREDPVPNWWQQALEHRGNQTTFVHVHHDPDTGEADGYLTFRYPKDGNAADLGEFFANTPAAYRGLLSTLHYYGVNVEKVSWRAPVDDPLPLLVMQHSLETSVSPIYMGRVVDVAAALAALQPPSTLRGSLTLRVSDSQCDWNAQTFALEINEGRVTAAATRNEPGVALDIQTLSQAYWGQPSLLLLRQAGRVVVSNEAQFELLSALLPPTVTFLRGGF